MQNNLSTKIATNNIDQTSEALKILFNKYSGIPDYYGHDIKVTSINTRTPYGDYPINIAAVNGNISGADVNAKGEEGHTPLHNAVEQRHIDTIKILLLHGADKTIRTDIVLKNHKISIEKDQGETPAELALLLNEQEIYLLLSNQ